MAKKKHGGYRRRAPPVAPTLGFGLAFGLPALEALTNPANITITDKAKNYLVHLTGYNPDTNALEHPEYLTRTLVLIGAGMAAHVLSAKLGLNKYLPKGINI